MKKLLMITALAFLMIGSTNAQTYDLNSFIELVKTNNKDILIAMKDLEAAETQDKEATANAYPQINAEAGYNRNLNDIYMFADLGALMPDGGTSKFKINYKNEFNFQTVVSQQIFNYTVFNAIKAAKEYEKLSNYVYDATFSGVINGCKKAFYQTLLLKEVWQVNQNAEKNARENYDNIKNKFDNGIVSEFELLQAEVRWKNLIPQTTQSKRNYELAINSLKSLAGIAVDKPMIVTGDFESYPNRPELVDLHTALSNRPDYNALLWEQKLRNTNIDVERAGHFPTLYGNFIYNFTSTSDEFKLEQRNAAWIAGLTLNIPIFSGWGVSARIQRAQIEAMQTQLKIDKQKDAIYTEIHNISLKIDEAENRINSAEKVLEVAKKGFQIADNSSKNGLATQLELKDARFGYDQAQLNYYAAVYDYLESYFDWQLAIGAL
ncbi:MAG: TolC family protein [Melioribacteraceae bacterium]|nr:TolC family protein [Melioribacteraceae bacterium]